MHGTLSLGILENIGLKREELKLSWWKGNITLTNLELNTKALEEEFPVKISRGFVKKLDVNIPWSKLLTSSIEIEVNGLTVTPFSTLFFY